MISLRNNHIDQITDYTEKRISIYIESFAKTDFTRVNLSPKERILDFKQSKLVAISVLLALSSLQNWENAKHANSTAPKPKVTCYFIFGDSISDNGNNNNLKTLTNVNYPPYGVDSPGGPTGRFTNGRTLQNFIAFGILHYKPPFAQAMGKGKEMLNGVNYASGPAGILDETGKMQGARVPFNEQIQNHKIIISRITALMRNDSATKSHLSRCIYSVQIGSNGHINNYFKSTLYHSGRRYTLLEFSNVLVQQLSVQLKVIYTGARKFTVYGVGMIGCTPDALSVFRADGLPCVQKLNDGATPFNEKLKPLLNELNRNLTNADFTDLIPSGNPTGLVTNSSCCQTGAGDGELCLPSSKPCSNPRQYIFWNGVHPTEAWNEMVVKSAYDSEKPGEAHPFNIRKLAMQPCPQALRS
ncbi:GDSL esterase/lipase At5g45670-like [Hibiscus syriacus]|uniref:GDSL esterase/lipase At5g45670-like n=1 Tax=Hibiscus syriacus TaxID=106335 RepID=UPI0019235747|nr:GDSL esterase/lipase At5g45670-like [Hibiscus syriacus]